MMFLPNVALPTAGLFHRKAVATAGLEERHTSLRIAMSELEIDPHEVQMIMLILAHTEDLLMSILRLEACRQLVVAAGNRYKVPGVNQQSTAIRVARIIAISTVLLKENLARGSDPYGIGPPRFDTKELVVVAEDKSMFLRFDHDGDFRSRMARVAVSNREGCKDRPSLKADARAKWVRCPADCGSDWNNPSVSCRHVQQSSAGKGRERRRFPEDLGEQGNPSTGDLYLAYEAPDPAEHPPLRQERTSS
ncbi:hypothetical protein L1887_62302 [Cichorium endivia]|nr:hypothetical protein L1887_62302 [Cichorium endivia]